MLGRIVNFILIVAVATLFFYWAHSAIEVFTTVHDSKLSSADFLPLWISGQMLEQGLNPYDNDLFFEAISSTGRATDYSAFPLIQIPNLVGLHYFLAYFNLEDAERVFFYFSLACLALSIFALLVIQLEHGSKTYWYNACLALIFLYCLLFSRNVHHTLFSGQRCFIVLMSLAFFAVFNRFTSSRSQFVSGIMLGLTLLKPNLFILIYAVFIVRIMVHRNWAAFFGFALGAIWPAFITTIIRPTIWTDYLTADLTGVKLYLTPTFGGWAVKLGLQPPFIWRLLPIILTCVCALALHKQIRVLSEKNFTGILVLLIPLSVALAPYAWTYDFVVMALPAYFLCACPAAIGLKPHVIRQAAVLIFVLAAELALRPYGGGMFKTIWFPMAYTFLCLIFLRQLYRQRNA